MLQRILTVLGIMYTIFASRDDRSLRIRSNLEGRIELDLQAKESRGIKRLFKLSRIFRLVELVIKVCYHTVVTIAILGSNICY